MKPIQSTAVIGAGALGLLFMDSFSRNTGTEAYFLSDENRFDNLKNKTFSINGKVKKYTVKNIEALDTKPDLILVCVKNHNLEDITPLLEKAAGPETIVVSVLNGISSELFLEELLPESTVLYCAVLGMDAVKEENNLTFTRSGKYIIGSKTNSNTDGLKKTCNYLNRCGLEYIIPEDIHRELWYKWMINIGVNQVSAVTGAPYRLFQKNRELQELMEEAMRETINVAQAEHINLTPDDINKWYKVLNTLGPDGKTSMLQDMEAKRKTEVESFSGELIKRARKLGIKTPVNETLFKVIKTRELLFLQEK